MATNIVTSFFRCRLQKMGYILFYLVVILVIAKMFLSSPVNKYLVSNLGESSRTSVSKASLKEKPEHLELNLEGTIDEAKDGIKKPQEPPPIVGKSLDAPRKDLKRSILEKFDKIAKELPIKGEEKLVRNEGKLIYRPGPDGSNIVDAQNQVNLPVENNAGAKLRHQKQMHHLAQQQQHDQEAESMPKPLPYPLESEADKQWSQLDKDINQTYPLIRDNQFIPMRRIVHLDLKGAPPRVNYFEMMFPVIKKLGATGILIEWEDMFPFKGPLSIAKNGFAYSEEEVKKILQAATDAGLEVIPLVQTFGHLEYILKLEKFAHLREDERYLQVLCVGDDDAWGLVQTSIDEVIEMHKPFGLPYFHMGADEAFQIGQCEKDAPLMASEGGRHNLILWHIARVAAYIRHKHNVKVLAWHDMFSGTSKEDLARYSMPQLIEPVVWAYPENLDHFLPSSMWTRLSPFQNIWGASSFKGADGPSRYWSNPQRYLSNQMSWLKQMQLHYREFKQFRGLILTGWSRYDHFALMAEILPVGFPSLAIGLWAVTHGHKNFDESLTQAIGCKPVGSGLVTGCKFPGSRIYELVQQLKSSKEQLRSLYSNYQIEGWLSRSNVLSHFGSTWTFHEIESKVTMHYNQFKTIHDQLEVELRKYFYDDMVNEYIYEYVMPEFGKLTKEKNLIDEMKTKRSFPVRPLEIFLKPVPSDNEDKVKPKENGLEDDDDENDNK